MDPVFLTLLPPPPAWPDPTILTGHLAATSLTKYQQAVQVYRTFCGTDTLALEATSLARWRTYLGGCP